MNSMPRAHRILHNRLGFSLRVFRKTRPRDAARLIAATRATQQEVVKLGQYASGLESPSPVWELSVPPGLSLQPCPRVGPGDCEAGIGDDLSPRASVAISVCGTDAPTDRPCSPYSAGVASSAAQASRLPRPRPHRRTRARKRAAAFQSAILADARECALQTGSGEAGFANDVLAALLRCEDSETEALCESGFCVGDAVFEESLRFDAESEGSEGMAHEMDVLRGVWSNAQGRYELTSDSLYPTIMVFKEICGSVELSSELKRTITGWWEGLVLADGEEMGRLRLCLCGHGEVVHQIMHSDEGGWSTEVRSTSASTTSLAPSAASQDAVSIAEALGRFCSELKGISISDLDSMDFAIDAFERAIDTVQRRLREFSPPARLALSIGAIHEYFFALSSGANAVASQLRSSQERLAHITSSGPTIEPVDVFKTAAFDIRHVCGRVREMVDVLFYEDQGGSWHSAPATSAASSSAPARSATEAEKEQLRLLSAMPAADLERALQDRLRRCLGS